MKCLLISLIVISACLAGSYATQCYVCTGAIQPIMANTWCSDPFDATNADAKASIQNCTGPCVKTYSKLGDDLEGYARLCSDVAVPNCLNDCGTVSEITGCQYCCTGDLCNSASSVTFNLLAAVAMLVSAWAFTS